MNMVRMGVFAAADFQLENAVKQLGYIFAAGVVLVAVCSAGAVTASPSRTVEIEGLGGRAVVDLQGGRILSWKTPSGAELLFMPRRPESAGGDWSHGGISICWPWFGKKGDRPSSIHGFAATAGLRFGGERRPRPGTRPSRLVFRLPPGSIPISRLPPTLN